MKNTRQSDGESGWQVTVPATSANLGCAVQHNIAAMVADPRDLLGPREAGPADSVRNATAMDLYEKGLPSAAMKHTTDYSAEQSAPGSGIGN